MHVIENIVVIIYILVTMIILVLEHDVVTFITLVLEISAPGLPLHHHDATSSSF